MKPEERSICDRDVTVEMMSYVLSEIARGRVDNGRPLAAETARQMAREVLGRCGLCWPMRRVNDEGAK